MQHFLIAKQELILKFELYCTIENFAPLLFSCSFPFLEMHTYAFK